MTCQFVNFRNIDVAERGANYRTTAVLVYKMRVSDFGFHGMGEDRMLDCCLTGDFMPPTLEAWTELAGGDSPGVSWDRVVVIT